MKDLRRWNPVDGVLPKGWMRKLTYRTSLWYDGLSSCWMEDVAAFSGTERSPLTVEATGNFFGVFGDPLFVRYVCGLSVSTVCHP